MKGFGSTGPILFPPTEMARMPWGEQDRAGSSGTRHHSKVLAGVSGLLHGKPEVECTELSHNRTNAARTTRAHVRRTRRDAAGDGRRHSATTQTGAGAAAQLWNKDDIQSKTHKTSRPRGKIECGQPEKTNSCELTTQTRNRRKDTTTVERKRHMTQGAKAA